MISRRTFFAYTGGTTLSLYAYGSHGTRYLLAQAPAVSLNPGSVPRYVTPLLIPPVMPKVGRVTVKGGKNADYYEISMKQFSQQILPAGLPPTTVWGYGAVASERRQGCTTPRG